MNKLFICFFTAGLLVISGSLSVEQEFIKVPKEKKFYPSCQQYIELNAEIVDEANELLNVLSRFLKNVIDIQKSAISEINEYVDGDKECFINKATKQMRADAYAKKMKIKIRLQGIIKQLVMIID